LKRNEIFPSRFLKPDDIPTDPLTVTISRVEMVNVIQPSTGQPMQRLSVFFDELDRPLVCNRTNFDTIAALHGDETDNWRGKAIALFRTKTELGGAERDCIRVQSPSSNLNIKLKGV
jgi:hypothetical protein